MGLHDNIELDYSATKCTTNNNTLTKWNNVIISVGTLVEKKNLYLKPIGSYKGAMVHIFKMCKALNLKAWKVVKL